MLAAMGKGLFGSLLLMAAGFIAWVPAGIPPAFVPGWLRATLLGWLVLGLGGALVARVARRKVAAVGLEMVPDRWPLEPPRRFFVGCLIVFIVFTVPVTFVLDDAVPAFVLGAAPGHAEATEVSAKEARSRGDMERTRVQFETEKRVVRAWVADPDHTLVSGSWIVFDRHNAQRVMAEETWAAARATPWRLPVTLLVWTTSLAAPFTLAGIRRLRFGRLRPGQPVSRVHRPSRHAKMLTIEWTDGSAANFIEVPGLIDAIRAKVDTDGSPQAHIP